jgi:diadenosine tetraphosphate (Ap4A) HIT family hydrolase
VVVPTAIPRIVPYAGRVQLRPSELEGVLWESEHWVVALNRNQNLLGKTMIVLRRPLERVADLAHAEWADLRAQLVDVTARLDAAFAPDHYNYAFLQNVDRQVHLHVIPRYAASRELAGSVFEDPDYPDHYAVPMPERLLSEDERAAVVAALAV